MPESVRHFDFMYWRTRQLGRFGREPEPPVLMVWWSTYVSNRQVIENLEEIVVQVSSILNGHSVRHDSVVMQLADTNMATVVGVFEEWPRLISSTSPSNAPLRRATFYWPAPNSAANRLMNIEGGHPQESVAILEATLAERDGSDSIASPVSPSATDGDLHYEKHVEICLRIVPEQIPANLVGSVGEDLSELLSWGATAIDASWGCVTMDQFDDSITPFEQWYGQAKIWCQPRRHPRGYYWANLLNSAHIEQLGGLPTLRSEVARVGFKLWPIGGNDRTAVLRINEPIDRYTDADLAKMKELLDPSLLYPNSGYQYYLGPPLRIVPDAGTAYRRPLDDKLPTFDDIPADLRDACEAVVAEARYLGRDPVEPWYLDA